MPKTPEMERILNEASLTLFGRERTGNQCVACGSKKVDVKDFKDNLSRIEFTISHLCQKCQDEAFGA